MNENDDITDPDTLRRSARAWVVRIQSGCADIQEAAELLRWRDRSPDHARALGEAIRLRRLMVDAGRVARATEGPSTPIPTTNAFPAGAPAPSRAVIGRRAFFGGAMAASVGAVMAVRPPLALWPSLAEWRADYRTGTGERRSLALADGASVDMNTRTSVALRHDGLRLIAGEVVVDASHAARPVAISTDAAIAVARSGRFGVRLRDGGVCVTCSAGRVRVDAHEQAAELSAGQQLTIADGRIESVVAVDTARVEAWRTGRLIFVDTPLGDVVDELNRYRPGKIILTGSAMHDRPVNAVFLLDHLDGALLQIREVAQAHATELPGGIILLS